MMNPIIFFIFTITCCFLMIKQRVSANTLSKPVIKLVTKDPRNMIMKGDTITLKCITGSVEGKEFTLVQQKTNGSNKTKLSSTGEFVLTNVQIEDDGDYFCGYCADTGCSALSSPLNIFVQDKFPRPLINVSPRRVVQPGATVTITCSAYYSNVEFSLLQNDTIVKSGSNGGNQFSYVISNAENGNIGYYSCMYESRNKGMQSVRSNPMKISVLALPAPYMTCEEDPSNSTVLRINCTASDHHKYSQYFFMLLDDGKVIDEIVAIQNAVTFSITKPKYTAKRYQCMYQIKLDYDYADSLYSIVQFESTGFYMIVFIRHILSALILILMGIILLLHFKDFKNNDEKPPALQPARVRFKKETEVVFISDDE